MATIGTRLLLIAWLAAAAPAFSQGRVHEFLGVKNWHGTVKITGTGSGTTSGGIYTDIWQYGITSTANFTLDTYDPNIQGWTGIFGGTSNINASVDSTFTGCTLKSTYLYQGPLPTGKTFVLILQGDNQYAFYPYDYQVQDAAQNIGICGGGTQGGTGPLPWSPVLSDKIQTLPATGFALKGSITVKMDSPGQPMSLVFGGSPAIIDVTITWDIEPGLVTPPELVIQKTSALQNWRPTAAAGSGAGQSVDLIAKLQATGGGSTNVVAGYFTWELTKSSKEPGYAMNAPVINPDHDFDLKLEGITLTDPNAQKGETPPGQYTQTTVTVTPYDWGAFGTIKVTAYLTDGSKLVGHLEGDTAQEDVRLPLRSAQSLIADVWKQNHGVTGMADVNDNESDPPGDGNPGDGLTLYEEYRGFIIDGQHVEGNPNKKDYFVLNRAGVFFMGGIRLFQSLSGLEVHSNLRNSELRSDRVMNGNHNEGSHVAEQHAVIINPFAANAGYFDTVGGPGTPGMVTQILAPRILPGVNGDIAYNVASLAHELFHACNVFHHGDAKYKYGWITRLPDDQMLFSGTGNDPGIPASILTEQNVSAASMFPVNTPTKITIGVAGDPHTGDDNCVMRYDDANAHFSRTNPNAVYYTPGEHAGVSLCTSGAGTGINGPNWQPQPRYGDAAQGRGNCRGQILVNDAVPAPRR